MVLLLLLMAGQSWAINSVPEGYKLLKSTTITIDAHGVCKDVTNSSIRDQFVATKTSAEWSSFLAHLPSGISATNCVEGPCGSSPSPGDICPGGGIYLGKLTPGSTTGSGTNHYMVIPGGCTNIPAGSVSGGSGSSSWADADFTPASCSGTDTTEKAYNQAHWENYDVPGLTNFSGTGGWGNGAINTDDKYGNENAAILITITALSQGGRHAAARYCDKLNYGGYTDWYLPNRYELNLVFVNKSVISGLKTGDSDFYSSSTEVDDFYAWTQRMSDGYQTGNGKMNGHFIRCVRRF